MSEKREILWFDGCRDIQAYDGASVRDVELPQWVEKHVRPSDPITSVEAAEKMAPKVGSHEFFALAYLKMHPNSTTAELEKHAGCRDGRIRKRLTDLREKGLAEVTGTRTCCVGGRRAQTWRAK